MTRYICIHCHFYQPPRENAWLGAIETQDSAAPFHDWNERITAECYAPNGAARILDGANRIARIVNNYAYISHNFGPTLLSWLEQTAPDVHDTIIAADLESRQYFSGHGSAMAQAYHHSILPLCNAKDLSTEVRWGLRDFQHRYGRDPEGMWLPEAAVNIPTLEVLAKEGLRFAVLSPYQAARMRKLGEQSWHDASGGRVDSGRAYVQKLPSGRSIVLFFYNGAISRAVAFEGLLNRGEDLAGRLISAFESRETPQLVHIATDGETYGHHHRFGEMALAYALKYMQDSKLVKLTNYGEFLDLCPPEYEVDILENSSWSCFHGIERWRSNCGCHTGGEYGWNQTWREPLRIALDWLRDSIAKPFESLGKQYLVDPWAARDDYVNVILDRSPANVEAFLKRNAAANGKGDATIILRLMELQRHLLMMYTSCGWFFNDISGIETVQVLQYAARAIQLAQDLFGKDLRSDFLALLQKARSNKAEYGTGADIYSTMAAPLIVDLPQVAAHYALVSLFDEDFVESDLHSYRIVPREQHTLTSRPIRLSIGTLDLTSRITREQAALSYGVLNLGAQTLMAGVSAELDKATYTKLVSNINAAFQRADIAEIIRILNTTFDGLPYSLRTMFRDQQREVVNTILADTLTDLEESYRKVYTQHTPLMRFLADLGMPLPNEFHVAAAFTLNASLRRALSAEQIDIQLIRSILEEARQVSVQIEVRQATHVLKRTLNSASSEFARDPANLEFLERFVQVAQASDIMPFTVDLWQAQNIYHRASHTELCQQSARAEKGGRKARKWLELFTELGQLLRFRVS